MENWKDIKGFEGLYQVNFWGEVKSVERTYQVGFGKKRVVKVGGLRVIKVSRYGYKIVQLFKNGKPFTRSIHRLVAEAFIENPMNYRVVNHIDGNKLNNSIDNLEWCSDKQNTLHYHRVLKQKSSLK